MVIGGLSLAFLKTRYQGDSEQGVSLDVDVTRMLLECYGNTNRQPHPSYRSRNGKDNGLCRSITRNRSLKPIVYRQSKTVNVAVLSHSEVCGGDYQVQFGAGVGIAFDVKSSHSLS